MLLVGWACFDVMGLLSVCWACFKCVGLFSYFDGRVLDYAGWPAACCLGFLYTYFLMLQQRCLDTAFVAAEVPRLSCCWQQRCLDTVDTLDTALVSQYTALVAAEALLGWACFGQLDLHWWVCLAYGGLGLIYIGLGLLWSVRLALVRSSCFWWVGPALM